LAVLIIALQGMRNLQVDAYYTPPEHTILCTTNVVHLLLGALQWFVPRKNHLHVKLKSIAKFL